MQRGEIYFVNLDPVQGREQRGLRPVVVVSIDPVNALPLVVTVVPGTDGANVTRDYPTTVRVSPDDSGLPRETVFLCFQARALDHSRFPPAPSGQLSGVWMEKVEAALRYTLGL
jgi:mRNA interferase MazF